MDEHMQDASYPEPDMPSFINPYPTGYDTSAGHSFGGPIEEDLYPPRPQPLIHEGYIPRSGYDSDADEDPANLYDNVRARFGLNHVLNPYSESGYDSQPTLNFPQFNNNNTHHDSSDVDELEYEDMEDRGRLNSIEREILDANIDADADSDFHASDDARSEGDMSITSDILDDILGQEPVKGRGRGRGRGGRGSTRGRRGWKWALKGTEHDPKRGRGGRGRGRGRGGNNVPRGEGRRKAREGGMRAAEPNPEFKRLQALATSNFLNQDFEVAADYAREAVKTNPEIFAAHSLLSEILLAEGKEKDSLTVLLAGAHTKREPALWWQVAARTLELDAGKREPEALEQAIYCYAWAIKLDPTDYESRAQKLNLLLEIGNFPRARVECKMMVKTRPHDLAVVRQYADLCAYSHNAYEIKRAREAYDKAIEFFAKGRTLGGRDHQWDHLNVYMDLVEKSGTLVEAVKRLKHLARWLLGRKEDEWWDEIEGDDREFDPEDAPRRIQLPQFRESKFQGKPDMYGDGLPMELRVKLGTYRAKMGRVYLHEAMRHFDMLMAYLEEVDVYADLFKDVAETLRLQTYHREAIQFYEPIRNVPDAADHEFFMHLAECYLAVDRKDEAEKCYKFIVDNDADDIESRIALAKFYEAEQRMTEAIPIVHEVMRLGRSDAVKKARFDIDKPKRPQARRTTTNKSDKTPDVETPEPGDDDDEEEDGEGGVDPAILTKKRRATRTRPERPHRPRMNETLQHLQQQDNRIRTNYILLKTSKDAAEQGDEQAQQEWMTSAHAMLDDFRAMKVFYPGRDKHKRFTGYGTTVKSALQNEMEAMKKRLQDDDAPDDEPEPFVPDHAIPTEFHDIPFREWLDIFCAYSLQLAKTDERDRCYDTLQAAFYASVFYHNAEAKKQIHATWLACALLLNDEQTLCNAARWFISEYSHSSTTYQLFAAVNRLFAGSSNWFNSGPTQKFILRSVKALDYALLDPASRAHYSFTGTERSSYTHGGKKDANPHNLPDLDPAVLALYGHIMAAAQSWASALNYYFRVLVLRPEDATINLCIALAYVQMAMKRQSENRHWQIFQGLAFMERYKALQEKKGARERQEAWFNLGRVWHLLGVNHLALAAYEKCLELAGDIERSCDDEGLREMDEDGEEGRESREEFTQEAAFALVNIYELADNEDAARKVTERWLVI